MENQSEASFRELVAKYPQLMRWLCRTAIGWQPREEQLLDAAEGIERQARAVARTEEIPNGMTRKVVSEAFRAASDLKDTARMGIPQNEIARRARYIAGAALAHLQGMEP